VEYAFGSRSSDTDYNAKILGQADRTIALDPNNTQAYVAKGLYLLTSSRLHDALRGADAGLTVDPNSPPLHASRSIAETYLGQFDKAKFDVLQAMRLSPRDPSMSQWHNFMADAEIGLANFDVAIDESSKASMVVIGSFMRT
jgi:lipoprotein NlpI